MTALTIFTGLAPSLLRRIIAGAANELAAQEQAALQAARLRVAAQIPEPVEAEPVVMPVALVAEPGGLVEPCAFKAEVAHLVEIVADLAVQEEPVSPSGASEVVGGLPVPAAPHHAEWTGADQPKRQEAEVERRASQGVAAGETASPSTLPAERPKPERRAPVQNPAAKVIGAIEAVRGSDRSVIGRGPADISVASQVFSRPGLTEMRRAVERNLDQLGHVAPWTSAKDLALVEAILAGFTFSGTGERIGVRADQVEARWVALVKPIREDSHRRVGPKGQQRHVPCKANNIDGQAFLVAELRRRALVAA